MIFNCDNKSAKFFEHKIRSGTAYYISCEGDTVYSFDRNETSEYLAIENHSPYWCRPFWGDSLATLPEKVQSLLIKDNGLYTYYLPVCDSVFKTLIRGGENGFEFYTYSNCNTVTHCDNQLAFVVFEGEDPFDLIKEASIAVCELLDNGLKLREEKTVPEVFNYLGWCSWDALQCRVNHEGLIDKAKEFKEKNVPVHYAIIDDMWADVPSLNEITKDVDFRTMVGIMHKSKLRSFEGDPKRFPKGMAAAVEDLKKEGIAEVGVWFPTTGYWSGLDPDGVEANKQKDNTVILENGRIIVAPEKNKARRYFDDFCSRIKSWGADFVKIDNQGFHHQYKDVAPVGESARVIQEGIDTAVYKYFDGALINCMGMPSECMYNRISTVSRCSDDFIPESSAWFAKNILQCSYNGLLQGQFYVNDWDMWWTDDEQAVKNSLCRAISGGPIYVSDKIGRTNPEILRPLCLADGRIVRPDHSATPTLDCLMQNPTTGDKIFKLRNRFGKKGVCAVFNINENNKSVSGTLEPCELGIEDGDYVYYEYFTKSYGLIKENERLNVTLENNDVFRLYSFIPFDGNTTVIGRLDLFMGVGVSEDDQKYGVVGTVVPTGDGIKLEIEKFA